MPPVTKAGSSQFRKDVAFAETKDSDEYELEAVGIVMVPDKADLQNDFARDETIASFADQFETFYDAGEADGGIMHAVFPSDWMALERNEPLQEAEEIGGRTVEAGAWVQRWGITNADLAALVDDGILEGYSIGAIQVDWDGPFEPDEVEDVDTSELPDDELVWELTDGLIREVSAVDIPAVPDAEILEAKTVDKRLADHLGNQEAFIEEAMERGHSETDAERMWGVLNDAMAVDGAGTPGEKSRGPLARAGKAFLEAMFGGDDDGATVAETPDADPRSVGKDADADGDPECWVCGDDAEYQNEDPPGEYLCAEHADPQGDRVTELSATNKQGQTLSQSNRDSAMAAVDANLDMLEDAGVDHGLTRFTDQEGVDFDLSEHDAREWSSGGDGDGDGDGDEDSGQTPNYAAGGDTPADDPNSTTMSDDPMADAPDWAKALHDDIQENSQRIDEALERQRPKTAEIQIDGETYEVRADAAKAALGVGEDVDVEEAIERLNEKASRVDEVEQRLDTLSQQSGVSTQLDAAQTGDGDGNGEEDALSDLGKALS